MIENKWIGCTEQGFRMSVKELDQFDHKIWDFFRENRKIHYANFMISNNKILIDLESITYKKP